MGGLPHQISAIVDALTQKLADAVAYMPTLAAAILIAFAGWVLARIVRGTIRGLSNRANRVLDRTFRGGALAQARVSPNAMAVIGQFAYWLILIVAFAIAARIAGFPAVSSWLDEIVRRLPNLVIGAAIIVAGYIVGVLVGEQVAKAAHVARAGQPVLMGQLAQSAIFATALVTGLAQIGVNVTFLIALFSVTVGAIFVGFSIAFGLGARDFVADLIGARIAQRQLKPGLMVRIGDLEGEIIEITSTQIVLDTPQGKALTPAARANAATIVILDALTSSGEAND